MGYAEKTNGLVGPPGPTGPAGAPGSGGSASSRATTTYTTPSLANLVEDSSGTIAAGKTGLLLKIATDKAARVRLYATSADRAADLSRRVDVEVTAGTGVILEVVTAAGLLSIDLSPMVIASCLDVSPTTAIYIAVQNLSGSTGTVTTTLTFLSMEA